MLDMFKIRFHFHSEVFPLYSLVMQKNKRNNVIETV